MKRRLMRERAREEMEEMMRRWIAVNDKAEQEGNWRHLADFYTENVVYGWDTPNGTYEFIGRESVRDTCVGAAMDPYKGWTYPYDKIVIDPSRGEAFCTWWQTPPGAPVREDGSEMKVIGASSIIFSTRFPTFIPLPFIPYFFLPFPSFISHLFILVFLPFV